MLQDLAISLGTSPPDSIQMVAILKTAYVMFPSVASAKKILYVNFCKENNELMGNNSH